MLRRTKIPLSASFSLPATSFMRRTTSKNVSLLVTNVINTPTSFFSPSIASTFRFNASPATSSTSQQQNENIQKVALEDGRTYEGPFDATTGAPTTGCKLTDGTDVYVGEYNIQWQRHGKGKATLDGGQTTMEGKFVEDDFTEGTLVTQDENGDRVVFIGTLKENQFHHGTLKHREYSYTGGFENNEPHGKNGVLKFATGALQEGTFFRGKLHGDNCKWKLESGQVYLGNFIHGVITSGELRTAEFTYEGEFNERGQAHGVGRQEHHTTTPKLIFRGHWAHGSLVTGQCHTDEGHPIDWQNNPEAQDQLNSKPQQVLSSYMRSKLDEARSNEQEASKRFAEDADTHYTNTGKRPDAIDLGYEAGPIRTAKIQQEQAEKSVDSRERAKSRAEVAAQEIAEQETKLKRAFDEKQKRVAAEAEGIAAAAKKNLQMEGERVDRLSGGSMRVMTSSGADATGGAEAAAEDISNWQLARSSLVQQRGKQLSTSDTIEDQFERFKLKRQKEQKEKHQSQSATSQNADNKSSSSGLGQNRLSGDEDDVVLDPAPQEVYVKSGEQRLRVDGNEPFVSAAIKTHQK